MFITEMELLKARLAAGKRLNDSHILKEIIQEDKSSEKKKRMEEGERYYCGNHDILQKDFRRSPVSEMGKDGEESIQMFSVANEELILDDTYVSNMSGKANTNFGTENKFTVGKFRHAYIRVNVEAIT